MLNWVHILTLLVLALHAQEVIAVESTYSVYDGDTITEHVTGSKPFGHRLTKVDAPEKAQEFGKEAKAFTEKLCLGKFIKFVATDKSSSTSGVRVGSQPTLEMGKDCVVIVRFS